MLRLADAANRVAYGEIAPIAWFGSETIEQAIQFCRSLPAEIEAETVAQIPEVLPACQFGFESAWESLHSNRQPPSSLPYCGLLPTGEGAIAAWPALWAQGYQTLKWKIAVAPIDEELDGLTRLLRILPATAKLRLDANGGLTLDAAKRWLGWCDRTAQIEFLEQPLPPDQFDQMLQLSQQFSTPIALDESVASIAQLQTCHTQGWKGIFVVKAAIAGSPLRLRRFVQTHQLDVVWSSALETAIARRYIETHLVQPPVRSLGMGVSHWFTDDDCEAEQQWNRH